MSIDMLGSGLGADAGGDAQPGSGLGLMSADAPVRAGCDEARTELSRVPSTRVSADAGPEEGGPGDAGAATSGREDVDGLGRASDVGVGVG
ncbi:MAG: hypothetical protein NWR17_09185, partial [Candidatus Nanopelagicales bacterium]|nr:hypothetical protein [Candidatus Nanopelagicales bacterium]